MYRKQIDPFRQLAHPVVIILYHDFIPRLPSAAISIQKVYVFLQMAYQLIEWIYSEGFWRESLELTTLYDTEKGGWLLNESIIIQWYGLSFYTRQECN